MKHEIFSYQNKNAFLTDLKDKQILLPFTDDASILASPIVLNGCSFKNRILSQPIEGFDSEKNGSPSKRSTNRYCQLSSYGYGCLWFESISVSLDGRSNPYQLYITKENCSSFANMLQQIREAAKGQPPFLVAQLTHSGRYSKPVPICGFENPLIPKDGAIIASDDYLKHLEDEYVAAALLADQAGFDAIDIRACHGYLLNEMFAAFYRPGIYGGSFENRIRLLVNIIKKIRSVSSISIGVRLNLYDGLPHPYGWGVKHNGTLTPDLREPFSLLNILASLGVKIFNISSGIGAVSPHVIRPYDRGDKIPDEHPLEGIYRMLDMTHQVKALYPNVIVVASALSWLREYAPKVSAAAISENWFDLAGFGRQCIAYPDFAKDILAFKELDRNKCCTTCCGCTALIKKSGKQLYCIRHGK